VLRDDQQGKYLSGDKLIVKELKERLAFWFIKKWLLELRGHDALRDRQWQEHPSHVL